MSIILDAASRRKVTKPHKIFEAGQTGAEYRAWQQLEGCAEVFSPQDLREQLRQDGKLMTKDTNGQMMEVVMA